MIVKKQTDINLTGEDQKQLQSALRKVIDNGNKVGFNNVGFTKEEENIIVDIYKKLSE